MSLVGDENRRHDVIHVFRAFQAAPSLLTPPHHLRKYHELYPTLPAGLKHPIFLCATPEVVDSVLQSAAASDLPTVDSRRWRRGAPYVHAVAASRDRGVEDEHEESAWFRDVFRVAVEVVADELWWLVDSDIRPVRRITRGVKGVGVPADVGNADLAEIWWSTAPSPEMVRRRWVAS